MDWNDHAATWDEDPAVRSYAEGAFDALTRILQRESIELAGLRVLDFGCGTGLLTESLATAAAQVVGLDPATRMIEVLRTKLQARGWTHVHAVADTLEGATAREYSPVAGPFDLVVCSSVCAFLPDYPGTVADLAGRLAPGGLFVQFDWERNDDDAEPYGLSRIEIHEALAHAGLTAVSVEVGFERPMGDMTMRPLAGTGRRSAN